VRVVFAGSAEFSVPVLRALAASDHQVTEVLTAPDRAGSRGEAAPRPVKEEAESLGLPVEQPPVLTWEFWEASPAKLEPEALVVAAYGQLVPLDILRSLAHGGLGVHPSLLPRHRGASPVAAAILAGDNRTGVTAFRMGERMDAGPILDQQALPVPAGVTNPQLTARLSQLGGELAVRVLGRREGEGLEEITQLESGATYSHRLGRQDGRLEWELRSDEIDRRLRALLPWPGVTVPLGGVRVKLLRGSPEELPSGATAATPGELLDQGHDWLLVGTGDSAFRVELIQPPGGPAMSPGAFLRGRQRAGRGGGHA
jgi:methionyl-tRNA formyltransferase